MTSTPKPLEPRAPSDSASTLSHQAEVTDTNTAGNVHGGVIMKLADSAAGNAAEKHCRGRAVTVAVDEMSFLTPVHVGDVLHAKAMVNEAFASSMEVGVRIDVETIPEGEFRHVSSAYLVFVATDENEKPLKGVVPPIQARTDVEKKRQRQAQRRQEQRLARKAERELG